MSPETLYLSVTEWRVMCAVWKLGSADASAVAGVLQQNGGRHSAPKAISAMLSRLARKGLVTSVQVTDAQRPGRPALLYSATMERERALEHQFRGFLQNHALQQGDFEILLTVLNSA